METNSLLYSLSTQGLEPSLGAVEAALRLYEREGGPMPSRVSCNKTPITKRSGWYSLLLTHTKCLVHTKNASLYNFSALSLYFTTHFLLSASKNFSNHMGKYHVVA